MKLNKFSSRSTYIEAQVKRNQELVGIKWQPWVSDETIAVLVGYLKAKIPSPKFGLCHGTRDGREQAELGRLLACEVLGTEISDTAERFPNTIQWDFHNIKDEWVRAVDFIYSNSLDHSDDPGRAMRQWMLCLRPGGLCFIDWSDGHGETHMTEVDCFGASVEEMRDFLTIFAPPTVLPIKDRYAGHVLFVLEKT